MYVIDDAPCMQGFQRERKGNVGETSFPAGFLVSSSKMMCGWERDWMSNMSLGGGMEELGNYIWENCGRATSPPDSRHVVRALPCPTSSSKLKPTSLELKFSLTGGGR